MKFNHDIILPSLLISILSPFKYASAFTPSSSSTTASSRMPFIVGPVNGRNNGNRKIKSTCILSATVEQASTKKVKKMKKKKKKKKTSTSSASSASTSASDDNNSDTNNGYGAGQITVLEGLDPVRKRPGM